MQKIPLSPAEQVDRRSVESIVANTQQQTKRASGTQIASAREAVVLLSPGPHSSCMASRACTRARRQNAIGMSRTEMGPPTGRTPCTSETGSAASTASVTAETPEAEATTEAASSTSKEAMSVAHWRS